MDSRSFVLSGWWRRVGAALIDAVILFVGYFVAASPLLFSIFDDSPEATIWTFTPEALAVVGLVSAVTVLYTCLLPVRTNGQTLGKMALSIRVVKLNGTPVDFRTMFVRYPVMQFAPALVGNYLPLLYLPSLLYGLLDYLFPLWDPRHQCIHDKVARTVVCYEGSKPLSDPDLISIPLPASADASQEPLPVVMPFYPPAMGPDPCWCPDPVTPGIERLWDGIRWTETYRGFFPDPDDPQRLRYFDGKSWTNRSL